MIASVRYGTILNVENTITSIATMLVVMTVIARMRRDNDL